MTTRILLAITFLLLSTFSFGQSGDTIYYNLRNKITWEDFKAIPEDTVKSINCYLATTIQMRTTKVNIWTGVSSFDVVAVVVRNRSWVKADRKTDSELRHQQLYHDISEVVARRLKTEINSKKINCARQKKIAKIFYSYDQLLADMHRNYAVETKQGTDLMRQDEWEKRILGELGGN